MWGIGNCSPMCATTQQQEHLLSHLSLKPWSESRFWVWCFSAGIVYMNACTGAHTDSSGKRRTFPAGPIYGDSPVPRTPIFLFWLLLVNNIQALVEISASKQPNKLCWQSYSTKPATVQQLMPLFWTAQRYSKWKTETWNIQFEPLSSLNSA